MTNPEYPASVQGSVVTRVMFTQHVKTYFQNTSLHGLQYVGEDGRPFMEKVLWMILFLLGIFLMVIFFIPGIILLNLRLLTYIYLVQGIHKFLYVPTSTSLDTRDYSIRNIDFPGVTICPNSKIMKSSFRAAMSSSKLSWANITAKMDEATTKDFRYSVLDYLANMVLFSGNPAGVMNCICTLHISKGHNNFNHLFIFI